VNDAVHLGIRLLLVCGGVAVLWRVLFQGRRRFIAWDEPTFGDATGGRKLLGLGVPLLMWIVAAHPPWQDSRAPLWPGYVATFSAVLLLMEILRRWHNRRWSAPDA
jgi:hypothetical protein